MKKIRKWAFAHFLINSKTDKDELFDFEEINFDTDLISFKDEFTRLPTLKQCIEYCLQNEKLLCVQDGLKQLENSENYKDILNICILPINSDPTKMDGDGDGILDKWDEKPLIEFKKPNTFKVVDNFDYFPEHALLNELRLNSDNCYNQSQNYTYGEKLQLSYTKQYLQKLSFMPSILLVPDAALLLHHYLTNTGEDYKKNIDTLVNFSDGNFYFEENKELALEYARGYLKNEGDKIIISSFKKLDSFEKTTSNLININWSAALGNSSAAIIIEMIKTSKGYNYKLKYIVYDFYDWDNEKDFSFAPGILPTDRTMYKLHNAGLAKQFYVFGEYYQNGEI